MASVTLTSEVESLAAHDVYCEITLTDSSSGSHDIFMSDKLGDITYEFDIPNDENTTTAVGFQGGTCLLSLENYIDGTNTVMSLISSSYDYDNDQEWIFILYFKEKDDTSYEKIYFRFDRNDVVFDPIKQYVELNLRSSELPDADQLNVITYINTYGDGGTGDITEFTLNYDTSSTGGAEFVGDFIYHSLWHVYIEEGAFPSSSNDVVFYSNNYRDYTYNGNLKGTNEYFVLSNSQNKIGQQLGMLASIEGAIYGYAMGKPFYVSRKRTDAGLKVTVDWDDVISFTEDAFYQPDFSYATVDWALQTHTEEKTSQRNSKEINIIFSKNFLYYCNNIDGSGLTCDENSTLNNDIPTTGAENYALAFSFSKKNRVKATINGFNSIYPYSIINFGTDAPSDYQSRDYRINRASYSFVNKTVTLDMYEI